MSDKTKAHLSAKTLWVLFILGLVNAVMYCFPYIRYVFYDQQIAAMGITNTQSGILMTIYAAANTITLIPGGILADKWSVKKCLVGSILGSVVIGIIYALTMNFAVACVLWAGLGVSTIFVFWGSNNQSSRSGWHSRRAGNVLWNLLCCIRYYFCNFKCSMFTGKPFIR